MGQLYVFFETSYKRFHSKILLYEKVKGLKKDSMSFYEVIMLAPLRIFAPKF